jgi:RNA polymerase sigma-70 factor (ECF subfamily)
VKGDWDAIGDPLAALRDGDPLVFESFVRTEAGTFAGWFRRQGASPEEAEDLTQEVFVRLVRGAPRYEAQDRLEAFCFRTARNVWIDRRRADNVRRRTGGVGGTGGAGDATLEDLPGREPEPEEPAARNEEARRALACIARLPEGQRQVFELGVVQELPYADIARLLSIPVGTVKSRMFHAVERLRALLDRPENSSDHGGGSGALRAANRAT